MNPPSTPRRARAARARWTIATLPLAAITAWIARAPTVAHAQNAQPQPDPQYQVLFVPSMVRNVCVGDEVILRFTATQTNLNDPLAALVPPDRRREPAAGQETFVIEATGGTISPSRVQLLGASEVFTTRFRAAQAGAASVTVRAARGSGSATRSFTIEQHCDYRIDIFGRAVVAQQGVRIEEVFIARGTLNRSRRGNVQGGGANAMHGDGTVFARLDMSNRVGPVSCRTDPITARGTFSSEGTLQEGDLEFSLHFDPITLDNGLVFHCDAPNMQVNLPVETGRQGGDANRLGLRNLSMGAWGGSMSFAYGPSTGVLTLTRQ
ncbi:MAG: hypothetical protein U0269_14730 [Polyangiales bacterium]